MEMKKYWYWILEAVQVQVQDIWQKSFKNAMGI
jgi:hypothetical protein